MLSKWWYWAIFFLLLFFIKSSSQFFLLLTIFFYASVLNGQSFIQSTYNVLLFCLPFDIDIFGISVDIIRQQLDLGILGYGVRFGLTFRLLIIAFLLLVLLKHNYRHILYLPITPIHWASVFLLSFAVISTLMSPTPQSWIGLLSFFELIGFFLLSFGILVEPKMRQIALASLTGLLLFWGVLGSVQLVLSRPLGLFVESRKDTFVELQTGVFTTDGYTTFRVPGTTSHATFFATVLVLLWPLTLQSLLASLQTKDWWKDNTQFFSILGGGIIPLGVSLIAIYGTWSRSGWLTLCSVLGLFGLYYRKKLWQLATRRVSLSLLLVSVTLVSLSTLLLLNPEIVNRLATLEWYSMQGNGTGRAELMRHSWIMIQDNFFFGVGPNNFTAAMITQGVRPEFNGFIYPVHNLFLLIFAELGVIAGGLFCFIWGSVVIKRWRFLQQHPYSFAIWAGLLSLAASAQVHTLFSQGPVLYYFFLLVALLLREEEVHV